MTTDDEQPGLRKEVILKFLLYFLAVVVSILIARLISMAGYDYLGWFVGGALIAFAMQMILVPRAKRRKDQIAAAVFLTGIAGMLVNYLFQ